jgi:hypothetical protein
VGSRALHYVTSDREVNSNRGGLRPVYPPKIRGICLFILRVNLANASGYSRLR